MRYSSVVLLCVSMTACTVLQPEKTLVHGSVWTVSPSPDIHQAIFAAQAAYPEYSNSLIDEVTVDSRSLFVRFTSIAVGVPMQWSGE